MTNRLQILRSSTPGQRPTAGARAPGELWTTFPDLQFGVIDASKNAQKLLAVRYFSTTANYVAGDFVVQTGVLYVANTAVAAGAFNSTQWVLIGSPTAAFMPINGGTMTGNIIIDANVPQVVLDKNFDGAPADFLGRTNGLLRWAVVVGDATAESGGSAGSNFAIERYADSGSSLGVALSIVRSTGATAINGALTVSGAVVAPALTATNVVVSTAAASQVVLNKTNTSGGVCNLLGGTNGNLRWAVIVGDATAEGGSNAGSNFAVNRYNDAGTSLGAALSIVRSTGVAAFSGDLSAGGNLSASGGVSSGGSLSAVTTIVAAHSGSATAITGTAGFAYGAQGAIIESSTPQLSLNKLVGSGTAAQFMTVGTVVGTIAVTGTTTAYNTTSDARLKTDEQSFDAGPILDATKVYDFEWTADGTRAYGVMAQEAEIVFPEAVTYDEDNDHWGVDYSKYVPLLLNEIKTLRARVAALEGG